MADPPDGSRVVEVSPGRFQVFAPCEEENSPYCSEEFLKTLLDFRVSEKTPWDCYLHLLDAGLISDLLRRDVSDVYAKKANLLAGLIELLSGRVSLPISFAEVFLNADGSLWLNKLCFACSYGDAETARVDWEKAQVD